MVVLNTKNIKQKQWTSVHYVHEGFAEEIGPYGSDKPWKTTSGATA